MMTCETVVGAVAADLSSSTGVIGCELVNMNMTPRSGNASPTDLSAASEIVTGSIRSSESCSDNFLYSIGAASVTLMVETRPFLPTSTSTAWNGDLRYTSTSP